MTAALVVALLAILVGTQALGWVARRFGQPAVLGEIVAGILLGGSVLGIVDPNNAVISTLSHVGVGLLLFGIGLETDVAKIAKVGGTAFTVAVAGVAVPFGLGYLAATGLGLTVTQALVCGAALCATSVGITARVLADLGSLHTDEGRIILGAAVIDDIIGLAILAVVATMVGGDTPTAGSALIVGSFGAGVVLHKLLGERRHVAEAGMKVLRFLIVPVFFAAVGAAVDLRALADVEALKLGAALIACGIVGKWFAGHAPTWYEGDNNLIGIGMIPRGEVGLIFAQMGLTAGAVTPGQYGALMLMVLTTTLVTPPALAWWTKRQRELAPPPAPPPPTPSASRRPSSSPRSPKPGCSRAGGSGSSGSTRAPTRRGRAG